MKKNLSPHYEKVIKDSKGSMQLATTLDGYVTVSQQLSMIQKNQKSVMKSLNSSLSLLRK